MDQWQSRSMIERTRTCTAETRRTTPGMNRVLFHALHESLGRHAHLVRLLPELQSAGEAHNVQTGICGEQGRW